MRRLPALALMMALAGCGAYDTHEARDPFASHTLIGSNVVDLIDCACAPDRFMRTSAETGLLQYSFTDGDKGFSATMLGLGLSFGGPSSCKMAVTVLRDGTVADITFPQSHSAGIALPFAACLPIVSECITHRGSTTLPDGFDAWVYLTAAATPPPSAAPPKGP